MSPNTPPKLRIKGPGRSTPIVIDVANKHSYSFAMVLTTILLLVYLSQTTTVNWTSLLATFAPVAVAAMANTPAIISGGGGFDVSISPIMILTAAVYAAYLVPAGLGGAISVPILLVVGLSIGALNGWLIERLRVQPVVVTLGAYFVLTGVTLMILPVPLHLSPTWIASFAGTNASWPGSLVIIALPMVVWLLLGATPYKRALYAVGSSDVAAFSSGVDVGKVRIVAYALGGLFAAIGGFAVLAATNSANATLSGAYTLSGIAAVALGGTSLWGGRGSLGGSALGAGSIYLLGSLFITLNANPSWLRVMSGSMLLMAVVFVGVAASQSARAKQAV